MFENDYGKHYIKYNPNLPMVTKRTHTNNTLSDMPTGLQQQQLNTATSQYSTDRTTARTQTDRGKEPWSSAWQ